MKIIILGGAGSGKDFLMRKLVEKDFISCVKTTTRPPRNKEIQGVTYNFVTDSTFEEMIKKEKLFCYQKFNVTPEGRDPEIWYYGIEKEQFENSQVVIMTPGEFTNITKEQRSNSFVVYLDIDRNTRESRLIDRRDNNDSIKRRMDADDLDFSEFIDYDLKITEPEFSVDDIYNLITNP